MRSNDTRGNISLPNSIARSASLVLFQTLSHTTLTSPPPQRCVVGYRWRVGATQILQIVCVERLPHKQEEFVEWSVIHTYLGRPRKCGAPHLHADAEAVDAGFAKIAKLPYFDGLMVVVVMELLGGMSAPPPNCRLNGGWEGTIRSGWPPW
jgi:hypothetical protein